MNGENPRVREAMDAMKKQLRESGVPEKKADEIVHNSARRYEDGRGAKRKDR